MLTFLLGLLKFLCSSVAIFLTWVLISNIISSVINPQFVVENGETIEKNNNARYMLALIIAVCWAIVIVIP